MAPAPAIRALLLAALLLLLSSQVAFLAFPQPGTAYAIAPVLYGLVPALVLSMLAERLPLGPRSRSVGGLTLAASAFAGLYAYLEAAHTFVACRGCAANILSLSAGSVLAFAGALALLVASAIALTMAQPTPRAPAPAPRTFAPARPPAGTNWPPRPAQGVPRPTPATRTIAPPRR